MRSLVRVLLSLAVAAGLVLLLLELTGTSVQEVWGTLRGMDRSVYLAALGVQALIYPVRTLRFAALLPAARRPPLQRLLQPTTFDSGGDTLSTYPQAAEDLEHASFLDAVCFDQSPLIDPQFLRQFSDRHLKGKGTFGRSVPLIGACRWNIGIKGGNIEMDVVA